MSGITLAAIKNRKITLLLTVAVVAFGLYSYRAVPKQENPDTSPPVALVTTVYPGASPEEVEQLVTETIEDAVGEIDGFDYVRSFSRNSASIVVVWLRTGADRELAWRQLRQEIDDVRPELPELCDPPEINTKVAETAGMIIALSGETYAYDQLASFAEVFERELSRIDGVSRFDIDGEVRKEVKVEVEVAKLNQYGFSLEDLVNILRAQNLEIPSGALERDGVRIDVRTPGAFESLRDIENTVVDVSPESGAVVRLRDFARVSMGLEEGAEKIRQNGANAVLLTGYFEPERNIVLVGREVRAVLDRVKHRFPADLRIDEVLFYPEDVDAAVTRFMASLLQGILLVIVVVFIGMGFRNAMIVSFAIPLSVLATIAVMNIAGIQIHQVSTAALIISLGMLVDNAIVIADAIQRRVDEGVDNVTAAHEGARESAIPVFTATLTTVAAYSPLLMLPGPVGDFVISLPKIVMISLSCSYVVAMIVTPTLAAIFFRPLPAVRQRESRLRRLFAALLRVGLRHRLATVAVALAALGATLALQSVMGLSFFPHADKDMAHIQIKSEIADLDATERLAAQVEAILAETPEITQYTTAIGEGLPKFFVSVPKASPSEDYAQVMFRYDLDRGERFASNVELAFHLHQRLLSSITGGEATVRLLELAEPSTAPVVMRLSGEDTDRLASLSQELQARLRELPGTMDVSDDAARQSLEFRVDVDDDVATSHGISKFDVQRQINIALFGGTASVFRTAGNEYPIVVRSDVRTRRELENLAIKSRVTGIKVLLKQVARVALHPRTELITRYQKERSVAVTSHVQPGFSSARIEQTVEEQILPTLDVGELAVTFDGEREKIKKNFGNVGVSALAALAAVYLILLIQFNSFRQPLVILITVPLSVIGAILGLFAMRQSLSFTAALGMASLIGIVVNNAILLLDFINKARARGEGVDAACLDAMGKRFRPIGLSTVTTVVGLTPLLMSRNPLFYPMAIALMAGLLVATLLTMVVIPVVFSLATRGRREES